MLTSLKKHWQNAASVMLHHLILYEQAAASTGYDTQCYPFKGKADNKYKYEQTWRGHRTQHPDPDSWCQQYTASRAAQPVVHMVQTLQNWTNNGTLNYCATVPGNVCLNNMQGTVSNVAAMAPVCCDLWLVSWDWLCCSHGLYAWCGGYRLLTAFVRTALFFV